MFMWYCVCMENNYRKTSVIVGVLFIIATAFFVVGLTLHDPFVTGADYLSLAYTNKVAVLFGALFDLIAIFAIILIPVYMFPILRKHNEPLALGYAGFRFLESAFLFMQVVVVLSLTDVSRMYLEAGAEQVGGIIAFGDGLQAVTVWVFIVAVSFLFPASAMILNYLLYVTKLVPRFLSLWGFWAGVLLFFGTFLVIFDVFPGMPEAVLTAPIAVQEMVFAVWLIVKGFNAVEDTQSI